VPVSLFVFAGLRLVPIYERISLWALPATYVGIALLADAAVRFGRAAYARRTATGAGLAVVASAITFVAFQVCYDIFERGRFDMLVGRPADSNHELDDRSGIGWLMAQHQPGDVLITTQLGLPALWWYSGASIAAPGSGTRMTDGSPILQAQHFWPTDCRSIRVPDALEGRRMLVYLGFRFDDTPQGFDDLLIESLSRFGTVVAEQRFSQAGRSLVFESRKPAAPAARPVGTTPVAGCVSLRPPLLW
jgi:hypothetical protein